MKRPFLIATESMMDALDKADGLSAHELRCFQFNFQQFTSDMIAKAECEETARKYPMGRHDLGKGEMPPIT